MRRRPLSETEVDTLRNSTISKISPNLLVFYPCCKVMVELEKNASEWRCMQTIAPPQPVRKAVAAF
jgi:hypothetical protein